MAWKGKFIGALIGFLITRNVWGAVIGAAMGQLFDQGSMSRGAGVPPIAEVFFRSTFEMMGHLAKSDGRVSEAEIEAARRLMQELRLGPDETAHAIACFRAGKSPAYNYELSVARLREACGHRHDLLRNFLELQMRAALAGDGISPPARTILARAAERLGLSGLEFARMEAWLQAQQRSRADRQSGSQRGGRGTAGSRRPLADCYAELEVDSGVSDQELTRAYRRQMSRHHPDKLVANGLPESMAQMAKEKTQRIQEAYEGIRAARGLQ
jgi:DnaJ like chaperone protein